MNDELRTLLTNKTNAQSLLDLRRERAEMLRRCVDSTTDAVIAADIEHRKAYNASLAADLAYEEAIKAVAQEAA